MERNKQYYRLRWLATGILFALAVAYVFVLNAPDVAGIVIMQRALEAGLIGGLADWFAVTALFRHPLGLRIPHTALLVTKKREIVQSVIALVQHVFEPKQIQEQLQRHPPVLWLLDAFSTACTQVSAETAARISVQLQKRSLFVARYVRSLLLSVFQTPEATQSLRSFVRHLLQRDPSPMVDHVRSWLAQPTTATQLGVLAQQLLHAQTKTGFLGMILQSIQQMMDAPKIGVWVQTALISALQEERRTEWEPVLRAMMEHLADGLLSVISPLLQADASLEGDNRSEMEQIIERLWQQATTPASLMQHVLPKIVHCLQTMRRDPEWIALATAWLTPLIAQVLTNVHPLIERTITTKSDQFSDSAWVELIERQVGPDIQWIRINGTLCGLALGLVFGFCSYAFG